MRSIKTVNSLLGWRSLPVVTMGAAMLVSCNQQVEKVEQVSQKKKPNILWIYLEDLSPVINCYGDKLATTPNIDNLAQNGVMFSKAFAPAPVCSPSRSGIITSTMPTTYNLHNHHSSRTIESAIFLPDSVKTAPELFKKAGYYTYNNGKEDYNFIYDRSKLYDGEFYIDFWFTFGGKGHWRDEARGDKPFFGQIQTLGGKWSLPTINIPLKEDEKIDPALVEIPPYYPDIKSVRDELAWQYDAARVTDNEVKDIVDQLKEDGLLENTYIFFFSDHGYKFLRHKQFLYDSGLQVPLIVAYFGDDSQIEKGSVKEGMVSLLDVTTTSLKLAGIDIPEYMVGKDLLADDYAHEYVFGTRDRCDFTIDRMRSVRSEKFQYIKNFMTDRSYMQPCYRDRRPEFVDVKRLYEAGKLTDVQAQYWKPTKPAEELYDLQKDPHQVNNIAADPAYASVLNQHRKVLKKWMEETDDKGEYAESIEALRFMMDRWGDRCVNPEYDVVKKHPIKNTPKVKIKFSN